MTYLEPREQFNFFFTIYINLLWDIQFWNEPFSWSHVLKYIQNFVVMTWFLKPELKNPKDGKFVK